MEEDCMRLKRRLKILVSVSHGEEIISRYNRVEIQLWCYFTIYCCVGINICFIYLNYVNYSFERRLVKCVS